MRCIRGKQFGLLLYHRKWHFSGIILVKLYKRISYFLGLPFKINAEIKTIDESL